MIYFIKVVLEIHWSVSVILGNLLQSQVKEVRHQKRKSFDQTMFKHQKS